MSANPATTPDRRTSLDDTTINADFGRSNDQIKDVETSSPSTTNEDAPQTAAAAPAAAETPEAGRSAIETFFIMIALGVALFLAAIDMTIVTTAVPTICSHFNSSAGYVWVGSAYLLGTAAFVPTWGKVSDIFGRKPVLLSAVGVFWIGSLLCGISTSMGMLIAARAIQGVGGGGIMVMPNICVSDLFSIRKRGMYFGYLSIVWAVASTLGPILGGVFTDKVSWRWCFYLNLPVGGVSMIILIFALKLHNPRTPIRQGLVAIDWVGSALMIGGTLMLLFGLESGGVQYAWRSATVICLIVFGLVTIGVFGVWENRAAKYPLMPIRLFQDRTRVAAYALTLMHAMTFMSGNYWLPLYFQGVLGVSPLLSGIYILPYAMSLSISSACNGAVMNKTGNYKPSIMYGLVIMTIGFGLFTDLGSKGDWVKIIIFQLIAGHGVGPNFQAPLIALQTNIEPRDIGAATSVFLFLRQLGTSSTVVIGGVIFDNEIQKQQAALQRELGPELASKFSGSEAASSVALVATLTGEDGQFVRAAYWAAMQKIFIVMACFAFLGLLISFFVEQKTLSSKHTEHQTGLETLQAEKTKVEDAEKTAA